MASVTKLSISVVNPTTGELKATWSWSKSDTDHYNVVWKYYNGTVDSKGKAQWWQFEESSENSKKSEVTAPSDALKVQVLVTPKAKNGSNKKPKWTATRASATMTVANTLIPNPPSAPTITLRSDGTSIDAILDISVSDIITEVAEFRLVAYNESSRNWGEVKKSSVKKDTKVSGQPFAAVVFTGLTKNKQYKVQCRLRGHTESLWSLYGEYSESVWTECSAPIITKVEGYSDTQVRVVWNSVSGAAGYQLQHTWDIENFNKKIEDEIETIDIPNTQRSWVFAPNYDSSKFKGIVYVRVRTVNNDEGEDYKPDWSSVISGTFGRRPDAPTTWSIKNSFGPDERILLYFQHNSRDNSPWYRVELTYTIDDGEPVRITESNPRYDDDELANDAYYVDFHLNEEILNSTVKWKMRTRGIFGENASSLPLDERYGPYSIEREFKIVGPPQVAVVFPDEITEMPMSIEVTSSTSPGSLINDILSLQITVSSLYSYETIDATGTNTLINENDIIFDKFIDYVEPSTELSDTIVIGADEIILVNGQDYNLKITAFTSSGLSTTNDQDFHVSFEDSVYGVNMVPIFNGTNCSANMEPVITQILDDDTEEEIWSEDLEIDIYRINYDGSLTKIADGLSGATRIAVTDPYPSLDVMRYRVIIRDMTNGSISFDDCIYSDYNDADHNFIIIQWDGSWSNLYIPDDTDIDEDDVGYDGNLLILPYNISISENHEPEAELVNYIGRENPVSYYGTQQGVSSNWTTETDKADEDTLYLLRQLQRWTGDCYVREPSGIGYWANVIVSYNIDYDSLVIPVQLNITKVEGDN